MNSKYHTILKPGKDYRLKYDAKLLKRDDVVSIFSVERGLKEPLYAGYCAEKDVWEQLTEYSFS
jgi:hypothetical protein